MAIKNKDGSPYFLEKPNQLMLDQALWTKSEKFTIHNSFGQIVIWQIKPAEEVKVSVEEPQPAKTTTIVESRPQPPRPQKTKTPTVKVWCLPARVEETIDPLYNEKYGKIIYGNKFMFDAIIQNQSDVSLNLWTNNSLITTGSIVFPQINDKRWWRVYNVAVAEEGNVFNVMASITDYHPDFSA